MGQWQRRMGSHRCLIALLLQLFRWIDSGLCTVSTERFIMFKGPGHEMDLAFVDMCGLI